MISVICPVFNEAPYIEKILTFFVSAGPADKELLVIDGRSTDGTREIIEKWSYDYKNIILVDNEKRFVPYGLNKAIKLCKGDLIVRLDGHSEYADDYFVKIIDTFKSIKADIVGGPMKPVGLKEFQKAIAYATTTKFGTGDSKFHDLNYCGYSDHVYLGSWGKKIFDELGMFDERLKVDHDDDFSYRARSMGKTIYISPEIKSKYYPRKGPGELFIQYYKYGFEKPIVFCNNPSQIKIRHLIPAVLSLYILLLPFLTYMSLLPMILYFLFVIYFSIKNPGSKKEKTYTISVYPIMHFAYGAGILTGFLNVSELYARKFNLINKNPECRHTTFRGKF